MPPSSLSIFFFISLLASGCSSLDRVSKDSPPRQMRVAPPAEAQAFWGAICPKGALSVPVRGKLWLNMRSPEFQGQFPAQIRVQGETDWRMEVTHGLGGVLFRMEPLPSGRGVKWTDLRISEAQPHARIEEHSNWNGIPQQWVIGLFQSRLPCPSGSLESLSLQWEGKNGTLLAREKGSSWHFRYQLEREEEGQFKGERLFQSIQPRSVQLWQGEFSGTGPDRPLEVRFLAWSPKSSLGQPPTLLRWELLSPEGFIQLKWVERF